ncbi:hypothetical protein ACFC00_40060 [Streptomyces adustus]|uniref:hypothetical protein n=1 Tax=Streptomyces adustus TaxID=1609272 RepID=UPI0035E173AB
MKRRAARALLAQAGNLVDFWGEMGDLAHSGGQACALLDERTVRGLGTGWDLHECRRSALFTSVSGAPPADAAGQVPAQEAEELPLLF